MLEYPGGSVGVQTLIQFHVRQKAQNNLKTRNNVLLKRHILIRRHLSCNVMTQYGLKENDSAFKRVNTNLLPSPLTMSHSKSTHCVCQAIKHFFTLLPLLQHVHSVCRFTHVSVDNRTKDSFLALSTRHNPATKSWRGFHHLL